MKSADGSISENVHFGSAPSNRFSLSIDSIQGQCEVPVAYSVVTISAIVFC